MENKRVAIVTWIKYPNFGTFLQAYALQQVISDLGYNVHILDDSEIMEESKENVKGLDIVFRFLFALKLRIAYLLQYSKNKKKINLCRDGLKLYDSFLDTHLKVDRNTLPLIDLDNRYDMFVCGSDQIWFPSLNIFSPYYYLSFTSKKKVAYAPSVGASHYPKDFIPKVKRSLERFDFLSVREERGAELLREFVEKPIETVVDPTLLLSPSSWEILMVPLDKRFSGGFIFCYFLTYNEKYIQFVLEYSRKVGLPLVTFAVEGKSFDWCRNVLPGGPCEFLTIVKRASLIFTDSFHGTIFSILFGKKFYTFKRFSEREHNNQNSRIENLFNKLNLSAYFLGEADLDMINVLPEINYQEVRLLLEKERQHSLQYLKKSLSD